MCCILGIIQMKKMHYILGYLYSYLLAFSWLSFHITLLLLCSVMLIIFTCWTVWWNITMTLSSSPPQWVGADIDAAISSLITCLFHFSFLHRRMPFHTTIPKRIQTMWVQYGLLSPSPPASNPESYPLPILFLQPHPTQPFPLAASVLMPPPPSGHRPLGCLCVLVRCFMVSWCDRAGASQHACDSDFSCPPPV